MSKTQKNPRNKREIVFIAIILIAAFVVRFYKIDTPLADFHSWRQADTAAVARNFVRDGFDLMHPRYDDFSNIQSGMENPRGYRMVEFPLYNALFGGLFALFGTVPLEVWGRIVSIIASVIVAVCVYYLVRREVSGGAAILAALIYSFLPFSIFFSRTILPEFTSLAFVFVGLVLLHRFEESQSRWGNWVLLTAAGLTFAAGLLTKPTVIFFVIPFAYLFFRKYDIHAFTKFQPYIFALLSFLPLVAWRQYIKQYPEGIAYNEWLITSVNTYQGLQNIFFRPAFFRWIFFERINNIIMGGFLSVFLFIGLVTRQKKYFLHSIFFASLAYLFTFQGGNVQHEYYQVLIIPALAIFTGLGLFFFIQKNKMFLNPLIVIPVILTTVAFSILISWYRIKDYYIYNGDVVTISSIVKSITKPEDKIITETLGDTTLLYLADRKGAPSIFKDLTDLQNSGYKYLVTQRRETIDMVKSDFAYPVVFENDKVAIFSLQ